MCSRDEWSHCKNKLTYCEVCINAKHTVKALGKLNEVSYSQAMKTLFVVNNTKPNHHKIEATSRKCFNDSRYGFVYDKLNLVKDHENLETSFLKHKML